MTSKHPNRLIHESSPYLLQHAYNPVDWHPWNEETLEVARSLNKMMLISIGYSACHWCHVMEHESFEDDDIAAIMNENFICVKIDREERPDVDQVYMDAVQLMTGSGGWPLNVFTLPDGKPFFGGTYFRKNQWNDLINNIALLFETRQEDLRAQAEDLTREVIRRDQLYPEQTDDELSRDDIISMVSQLGKRFDDVNGGDVGSPKFPMPNNYRFLLNYYHNTGEAGILDHITLTLRKLSFGGIYDQIGGGFARYSVDDDWKVPHFEKMLYDNAQLLALYSEAFQVTGEALFKDTVRETFNFITREMTHPDGGFYSTLDADSEGIEGKYYTWSIEELDNILGENAKHIKKYYEAENLGMWEDNRSILLRTGTVAEYARKTGINKVVFKKLINEAKKSLLAVRNKRIRPGLDDKILTSWNALMIRGLTKAYKAFGVSKYMEHALSCYNFLDHELTREDGGLFHTWKDSKPAINGFLEDYCHFIDALTELYQVTFDEVYLQKATLLLDYTIRNFSNEKGDLFHFTSVNDKQLIARKTEVHDNVIPSGNSTMAMVLYKMGHMTDNGTYLERSEQMLNTIKKDMIKYPSAYSNWGILGMKRVWPHYNIAISGNEFAEKAQEMNKIYSPNKLLVGSESESELPLLQGRYSESKTLIYVCSGKSCELPVKSVKEAIIIMSGQND